MNSKAEKAVINGLLWLSLLTAMVIASDPDLLQDFCVADVSKGAVKRLPLHPARSPAAASKEAVATETHLLALLITLITLLLRLVHQPKSMKIMVLCSFMTCLCFPSPKIKRPYKRLIDNVGFGGMKLGAQQCGPIGRFIPSMGAQARSP
ncbi:hypothetical protein SUGI_0366140 [Cryptomeria japonica]|nr:hypothetical protein SUGI_0366140 [Cryptomeria japonica]